jgi:hypothetical protein
MPVSRRELQDDAVRRLNNYIPAVSNADFIASLLSGNADSAALNQAEITDDAKEFSNIANSFVDIINGGTYTSDALTKMNDFLSGDIQDSKIQAIRRFIRITLPENRIFDGSSTAKFGLVSGAKSFGKEGNNTLAPKDNTKKPGFYTLEMARFSSDGENPSNPDGKATKATPHVSVIELLDSRIGVAVRDTAALSIFTSMIPTQTISRAVPYVSISVITSGSNSLREDGSPVPGNFNLVRYLRGREPVTSQTVRPLVTLGTGGLKPGGMELFTSPQTLVSDYDNLFNSEFFPTQPVDRFRPLLTLTNLTIGVVSAGAGMMSYKNASMNVVLHDRGRLSEISQLVQPGAYKDTEIEIEYGWSIDPGSGNATKENGVLTGFALQDDVFAQFIDSLRCKERFGVVNSSFEFDDAGQVKIALTLFTKSAYELRSMDISSQNSKNAAQELKKVIEDIKSILAEKPGLTNFLGEVTIEAGTSAESALALDKEKLKELQKEIDKLRGKKSDGTSLESLADKLSSISTTVGTFQTTSEAGIAAVISTLNVGNEIFPPTEKIAQSGNSKSPWSPYTKGSYSLGRVVLHLVAKVLANTNKFDEIQLVFGKINSRAGNVRNLSMAAFPLDAEKLENDLKKLYKERLSVSVETLLSMIGVNHVSNIGYPAYGFSGNYNEEGEFTGKASDIDKILFGAGIKDANFILPKLYFYAECVPAVEGSKSGPSGGTILRLFIGDEQCTPHQGYAELVNAARTDSSFLIDVQALDGPKNVNFPTNWWADLDPSYTDSRKQAFEKLKSGSLLVPASPTAPPTEYKTIKLAELYKADDPRQMKRFLSEGLPVIKYGNSAGTLKNLSVMSISDPALATINIIASDEAAGDAADASRKKGLPLIVTPTEVTIDLLGCPLLNFGQSVYIDFGTGTTVDNIYGCNSVTHTFSPGEFSTQAKFHINVGAYGIYNSISRQIDIANAQTRDAAKE